jgi:aminoglycoside 6'-N-acetyltransferase
VTETRGSDAGRPTLEGAALTLRPADEADASRLMAILDEPEVALWWRRSEWERVDEQDAVTFVIVVRDTDADDDEGADKGKDEDAAGVTDAADHGRVLGCIQYVEESDPDYLSAAIDIFVSAAVHGHGVGPAAMRLLIAWLIDARGHHRITVDPAAENAHAIHVYEKLGFRCVGVLRQYERVGNGVWRDALLMELVAADFVCS